MRRFDRNGVMRRRALAVACLVALAIGIAILQYEPEATRTTSVAVVSANAAVVETPERGFGVTQMRERANADAIVDAVVDPSLLATPEAQAHFARERFNSRAREFFARAASLDAATRNREAAELESAIDAYERTRELSAGEAMLLRAGLVEASGSPAGERADRMAAIVARYESDGREREARWLAQQAGDAAFARYKARESVVVAEVMAMTQIPDGLSRDEYLRRRLEAERIAAQP